MIKTKKKMTTREIVGWTSAILFGACALPQVLLCIEQGHAQGLATATIAMWFGGEVCGLYYIWPTKQYPLIINYALNLTALMVIGYFKVIGG